MESVDLQVLETVRRWAAEGRRHALITVAHTWGSAPRPPGSWLAINRRRHRGQDHRSAQRRADRATSKQLHLAIAPLR